jgi:hypothetical protein
LKPRVIVELASPHALAMTTGENFYARIGRSSA